MRAHLHQRAANGDAIQHFAGNARGGDPCRRFTRRGTATAAIIAHAVFFHIGEIGMARPVFIFNLAIIFRALIGVFNHQRYWRAGGHLRPGFRVFKYARQNFHLIGFAPLGGEFILPGFSFVEPVLNIGLGQWQARGRTVNHAAKRGPVAFAPSRNPE